MHKVVVSLSTVFSLKKRMRGKESDGEDEFLLVEGVAMGRASR